MSSTLPCVDRVDYRFQLININPAESVAVLNQCPDFRSLKQSGKVRIRHTRQSTAVRFRDDCSPVLVDRVYFRLMRLIFPDFNRGLLEAYSCPTSSDSIN
jgi:hypothetical protein